MNSLKGLGVCVVLAGIAFAMTKVSNTDQVILGASLVIIGTSLVTYLASIRRSRKDRRIAGG
ncbi:ABC-type uncharacterized transport system permease subunit [Kitasatospora sp. MAA4]|uniref:hypothetical protein n=1 Tax=Kitasatospora sp. MAA4 TaxID=3035093 RepID=UPI002473EEA9|nr:hypothetical protein [Kitasatospora sp. MAA4]MDH6137853.1 ABC-type uncharacterized transport system permease subunit [Kitasatospora sp. MAA4]